MHLFCKRLKSKHKHKTRVLLIKFKSPGLSSSLSILATSMPVFWKALNLWNCLWNNIQRRHEMFWLHQERVYFGKGGGAQSSIKLIISLAWWFTKALFNRVRGWQAVLLRCDLGWCSWKVRGFSENANALLCSVISESGK